MKQIVVDIKITGMKHVVTEHHLPLLYGALKTNKAAWDKLDSEIQVLNSAHSIESDGKILKDSISRRAQTHAVIIIVANCLIEALANLYLTYKCDGEQFNALERLSTLDKLVVIPKLFLKKYEFPKGEALYSDLKLLLDLRTSLVHPKPKVTVNEETTHKGNLEKSEQVAILDTEKCASLPARVVAHIWNYDQGALAELYIKNSDFSDTVILEDSKAKARLKQRGKK